MWEAFGELTLGGAERSTSRSSSPAVISGCGSGGAAGEASRAGAAGVGGVAGRSGSVHERSRTEGRGVRSQASELGDSSVQHAGLFDAVNVVVMEGMRDHRGASGEFHQEYCNTAGRVVALEGALDQQQ